MTFTSDPEKIDIEAILDRAGPEMAEPLLDALTEFDSPEMRRKILHRLAEIGEPVARLVPERLEDERWYVRRNLLSLLTELPVWPDGFSAMSYLDDPDPRVRLEAFRVALDHSEERDEAIHAALESDDRELLRMALAAAEASCPPAVEPLVAEHAQDSALPAALRVAAVRALDALRRKLGAPRRIRRLLRRDPPDWEALDEIYAETNPGRAMILPLLDGLVSSDSRSTRRQLFTRLVEIGAPVAPLIPERLADRRWFVRRNLLALLAELPVRPDGFSGLEFVGDPDPRVRVEAFKVAAAIPREREAAVRAGLASDNERLLRLALAAAEEEAPPSVQDSLLALARDEELATPLRAVAVRALGTLRTGPALEVLLELTWQRRFLIRRLAPPSPLMLAALGALARDWREHPDAKPVLEKAAASDDERIREAVT